MTVLETHVLDAARSVAEASRHGESWVLSETLRQLRASLYALDHGTPEHLAPIPESVGTLRAVHSAQRSRRRIQRR